MQQATTAKPSAVQTSIPVAVHQGRRTARRREPGVVVHHGQIAVIKAQVDDFGMGECLCEVRCRLGHETRLFNFGRAHFVACLVSLRYTMDRSVATPVVRAKPAHAAAG